MTFVDSNVFIYHVGGDHPLRGKARAFIAESLTQGRRLVSSAEVLQELLHVYIPPRRWATLDAAFELVNGCLDEVWPIEKGDVELARDLARFHPGLSSRDLIHLACCRRRNVDGLMTFDPALTSAWR